MKSFLTFSAALLTAGSLFAGVYQPPAKLIAAPDAAESEWRFRLITYGWLTAVDGNLSLGGITAPIDVSMSDTLDTLDMAYMGYFEVGYDRWSVGLDVVYGKTSDDLATGGRFFDSFRIELKQLLLTPIIAYRVIETPDYHMEIFAGARITTISTELTARLARGAQIVHENDSTWVDPMIGVRGQWDITDCIFFRYNGDIGGFGVSSELIWQAFGGIGYRFNDSISAILGYRGMGMDYEKGAFELDTITHGPVAGLEVQW